MAGRYLATELQDDNGNVIYPHTEADIVFTSDGTTVEENLDGDVTDTEMQEIFGNSNIPLEAGKNLSVKGKIKKALKRYQTLLRMRILDTVEEVEANTDDGYLMGAKAGAALINDLAQQPQWIKDSTGKIIGYKTFGGADTVFPFRSSFELTANVQSAGTNRFTVDGYSILTVTATSLAQTSIIVTLDGKAQPSLTKNNSTAEYSLKDISQVIISVSSSAGIQAPVTGNYKAIFE